MNKGHRKQEIREKVKEMKQRQQNWMKQRAENQMNTSVSAENQRSPSGNKQVRTKPVDNIKEYQSKKSLSNATYVKESSPAEQLVSANKSKAKFHNWLKAKQTDDPDEDPSFQVSGKDSNNYNSQKYTENFYRDQPYRDHKGSGEVNVLRVSNSRPSDPVTPDPGWTSDDETGEITAATLLSPEDFDSRADDIIAKVKGDMKTTTVYSQSYDNFADVRKSIPAVKTSTSVHAPATEHGLASHVCPTCDKLMLPPTSSPMLLIPCGHTLCSSCCRRTKYCAMCGCEVHSNTPNNNLQQIITDFHTKQTHRHPLSKTALVPKKNYHEEYQNLVTRQEILTEELDNISVNIGKLHKKLKHDQQQVNNITKKEKHLESEIVGLQQQLADLVAHRSEYERTSDEHEIQYKQEKNRLSLVQDSLTSVQQQIEKVKLLAGDY